MLLNGPWVNPRHGRGPRAKVTALARRGTVQRRLYIFGGDLLECIISLVVNMIVDDFVVRRSVSVVL